MREIVLLVCLIASKPLPYWAIILGFFSVAQVLDRVANPAEP